MDQDGGKLLIALGVVAVGIGAVVLAEHLAGRDPLRCQEREYAAQSRANRPSVSSAAVEAPYEAPSCAAPKNDKEDDLCQQRRMARAADEAACVARWQFWISLFGLGGLLGTIIYAAQSARATGEAVTVIAKSERAFVKMSHTACGINLYGDVRIHLKNYGRTPADVIGVNLRPQRVGKGDTLPAAPAYEPNRHKHGQGFLVANDEYWITWPLGIAPDAINDATERLYVYGYVDYRDRMTEQIHRAGYGRLFERTAGNNLVVIPGLAYNYDRPRMRSEANDWDNAT